jgi:hypothetical protein
MSAKIADGAKLARTDSRPSQFAAPAHDAPVENKDNLGSTVPTADEPFVTVAQQMS